MTNTFRVLIIGQNEQAMRFIKSMLHYKPDTTQIITAQSVGEILKAEKFNLIIESERIFVHPKAAELIAEAETKLV